ncbi:SAM-dependent methyltransferase [Solwaraspora sp. WMMD791]|uniref:SAM-dependent methyltransferase n=1 Tax=Solwaraspora sp. WMMD791 TaxID=3016086 RepID=UPI00249A72F3|nr:SAM-dependent methyltransferase [Solwaraspora sp. WMMD791]WFE25908.1 SAM-dependent methyltransferase [Solwaraspora sp. WMMD791]
MSRRDWSAWHEAYADPDSALSRRLVVVQARIRETLDAAPPGPVRVVSMCAGEGRDVLGVLDGHPRRTDVRGRLVELDPQLADRARRRAAAIGVDLEVVTGDAARSAHYAGAVPADLVLLCGVFGNIADVDVARVVAAAPQLTAAGGTVVWTRHRREPDLVPRILEWFAAAGFVQVWLSDKSEGYGVGVHRFAGVPAALRLRLDGTLFRFVGRD